MIFPEIFRYVAARGVDHAVDDSESDVNDVCHGTATARKMRGSLVFASARFPDHPAPGNAGLSIRHPQPNASAAFNYRCNLRHSTIFADAPLPQDFASPLASGTSSKRLTQSVRHRRSVASATATQVVWAARIQTQAPDTILWHFCNSGQQTRKVLCDADAAKCSAPGHGGSATGSRAHARRLSQFDTLRSLQSPRRAHRRHTRAQPTSRRRLAMVASPMHATLQIAGCEAPRRQQGPLDPKTNTGRNGHVA